MASVFLDVFKVSFFKNNLAFSINCFQIKSFPCPDKQGTPEEGWRIQQLKRCVKDNNHKDEDNSLKNNTSSLISKIQTDNHINANKL